MSDSHTSSHFTPEDIAEFARLRDLAVDIATGAADLVRTQRARFSADGSLRAETHSKSSDVDPVTIVDKASEKYIVERIGAARPDDGILGEEGANKPSATGYQWIVDPIDGTVNFLYNIPEYAVSVGIALGSEPVAGAVVNVATGDIFQAAHGAGATVTRDGKTSVLQAAQVEDPARALVSTGFGYTANRREAQAGVLTHLLPRVRDIRRMGAAALEICRVAEGVVDAYYEHGIHPWDYAAGAVIATESGVVFSHPGLQVSGTKGFPVVATAPGISGSFRDLFAASGGDQQLPQ
ncbi:inositol monophosphatase family protein [Corynebacterium lubricantis]|uniref:inositol monophosphatase family protein n=1 Tax=Corynebacterium lubricantis TaxID=541095 RepID=UPI00036470D6|nr:inositol monophosphatase family protein [Corynebacterium lubricantis]